MKKKSRGTAMSIPGGVALAGLAALIMTVVSSMIMGKMVEQGNVSMEHTGYILMGILITVSFVSALMGAGVVKHRKALVCAVSGAVYFGILMSITALFFGGQYGAVWETGLLILAGTGAAVLVGAGGPKTLKMKNRKHS